MRVDIRKLGVRFNNKLKKVKPQVTLSVLAVVVLAVTTFTWSRVNAAPAFVQIKAITGSGLSKSVDLPSSSNGNLIAVYVAWSSGSAITISDSKGNTYAAADPVKTWTSNNSWRSQVWYAKNIVGGAVTVTATLPASATIDLYAAEYSGLDKSNPLDVAAVNSGRSNAPNSGNTTTTYANDLLFAAGSNGGSAQLQTPGAGYTTRSTYTGNEILDRVVSTTGSYNASATVTASNDWVMHMVAFKAAQVVSPIPLPSTTPSDTTAPSTPSNVMASVTSTSSALISWNSSTDNVGVNRYNVYRNDSLVATVSGTTYSDTGLSVGTSYAYAVTAVDAAGNQSAKSTTANVYITDAYAPANLVATVVSSTQINLSWAAPVNNVGVTSYKLFRNGTVIATPTGTSYNDTGLVPGAQYTYQVSAVRESTSSNTAMATTTTPQAPPVSTRDPLKWPFASNSIWNMPIGSGAQFAPANLAANPGTDNWTPMPQIDEERIILKPTAPMTQLRYSSAAWSGANRCSATNSTVLTSVPIPSNYIVPNTNDNEGAVFLMPDGRTIIQSQPFSRCTAGSYATSLLTFPAVDIYGEGITGAHGGSRMSSFGGSIRVGELRPGQQGMRHAVKLNVDSEQALYRCTTHTQCFRWPSQTADSGAAGNYGTKTNNQNTAMKMGSLLAIPGSVDINAIGLESVPGKQMAWTLQNYGAYIVDSTGGPAYGISAEDGPDGSVATQFKADYGYDLEARINSNTAWSRDFQRLMTRLQVVNNNSPTSIGGGGTPRQPLAPPI